MLCLQVRQIVARQVASSTGKQMGPFLSFNVCGTSPHVHSGHAFWERVDGTASAFPRTLDMSFPDMTGDVGGHGALGRRTLHARCGPSTGGQRAEGWGLWGLRDQEGL